MKARWAQFQAQHPAGIAVASLVGIGAGLAIGAAGYDAGAGWVWGAAGALLVGASAFALGAASRSSPPAHGGDPPITADRRERDAARDELDGLHSALSHGLRSPIGAAINFATVLEGDFGDSLGDEGRSLLARIRRSASSALALVDGLARLSAVSRRELTPEPIDPEPLVRASFAAVAPADRSLEFSVVGPLPSVCADAELLRTAFDELLANALRSTAGREKARVAVGGRREDGAVVYWVEDNGVGFAPRFAGRLFRPFEKLHRHDAFPGAGVGLAIVRRIAERHGGSADVDAALDRGARFQLTLPASPVRSS
jgi:signal transduction histidine kinase